MTGKYPGSEIQEIEFEYRKAGNEPDGGEYRTGDGCSPATEPVGQTTGYGIFKNITQVYDIDCVHW
ncbi:hypothetical protein DPMN_135780 [Dreissena polymorpha]|uniref:Uncharacterized protein n=1 Tax=Dreissena polymorpha TaxID=45954 RepID=A0A9D4JEZ5_DREPO|nr:hypothetical protein DPMN_135780 [Dreissena polymorpha]